jgi:hypothetical protein
MQALKDYNQTFPAMRYFVEMFKELEILKELEIKIENRLMTRVDKRIIEQKACKARHKDKIKQYQRIYYKAYRASNKEKVTEYQKNYRENHKEKIAACKKEWRMRKEVIECQLG